MGRWWLCARASRHWVVAQGSERRPCFSQLKALVNPFAQSKFDNRVVRAFKPGSSLHRLAVGVQRDERVASLVVRGKFPRLLLDVGVQVGS